MLISTRNQRADTYFSARNHRGTCNLIITSSKREVAILWGEQSASEVLFQIRFHTLYKSYHLLCFLLMPCSNLWWTIDSLYYISCQVFHWKIVSSSYVSLHIVSLYTMFHCISFHHIWLCFRPYMIKWGPF